MRPCIGQDLGAVFKVGRWVVVEFGDLFISVYDWFRGTELGTVKDGLQCDWDRNCKSGACGRIVDGGLKYCCHSGTVNSHYHMVDYCSNKKPGQRCVDHDDCSSGKCGRYEHDDIKQCCPPPRHLPEGEGQLVPWWGTDWCAGMSHWEPCKYCADQCFPPAFNRNQC